MVVIIWFMKVFLSCKWFVLVASKVNAVCASLGFDGLDWERHLWAKVATDDGDGDDDVDETGRNMDTTSSEAHGGG